MQPITNRLELLDLARGIALVAMTIFHFAFDLQLFGFREPGFIEQPHWKYFARSIASTFLFLTGFSLYIAHHDGVLWSKWSWRMAKITGAAIVITIATYFATPGQFIFFGILHQIAFASFACLLFLRFPPLLTALLAVLVFWIGQTQHLTLFDHPAWWWTGLSAVIPVSSDFVPVFPWWSASLLGFAIARFCHQKQLLEKLSQPKLDSRVSSGLKFLGRNSLIYYLLHQPVMIGFILAYLFATGQIST